jgi:hypothetical protein
MFDLTMIDQFEEVQQQIETVENMVVVDLVSKPNNEKGQRFLR